MYDQIFFPIDGSEPAASALDNALQMQIAVTSAASSYRIGVWLPGMRRLQQSLH